MLLNIIKKNQKPIQSLAHPSGCPNNGVHRHHHAVLHADWRSGCAERFSLLYLPAYSPELNPIERIWKLTRRLATHNRYFAHLEEVAHAVESLFENWKMANTTLSKLCAII